MNVLTALMAQNAAIAAGLVAVLMALAAGVGAAMAASMLGRRRFQAALWVYGTAFGDASDRLDAAADALHAVQKTAAQAASAANDAGQGQAAAAAALSGAVVDAERHLRIGMEEIDQRHATALALAAECEQLARVLPEVLAAAIDRMEARGLPAVAATVDQLREFAAPISAGLLRGEALATTLDDVCARLEDAEDARNLARADDLPAEDTSERVAAAAALGQAAVLAASIARVDEFVGVLPDVVASLARGVAQLRRDSGAMTQSLAHAAGSVQAAGEAVERSLQLLDVASARRAA